jgi:thiol-disulfide isomerase/thioredoxin
MRTLKYLALVLWVTARAAEVPGSKTAGVGVVLGVAGENIIVKDILPDSPAAAQKSMHVGDKIVAVAQDKEAPVQLQNLAQAVPLLRGAPGTTVRLTIVPAGEDSSQARVVSFVRAELKALTRWGDGVLLTNGLKAPDIEMVRLPNGGRERLANYAGKIVLLEFWATWCDPCQPKLADLQTYSEKYPDWKDKVILIAASVDDSEEAPMKHLKAKGWVRTHNVWVGIDAKRAYHIDAIPTAYVIDRQGNIVAANPGDLSEIVNQQLQTR